MEADNDCFEVLPPSDLTEKVSLESVSTMPRTPVHDQETPEGLHGHKNNTKCLKQGRLLFPHQTPPTNNTPNKTNGDAPSVIATPGGQVTEMDTSTSSSVETNKSPGGENMEVFASPVPHGQEMDGTEQSPEQKAHKMSTPVSTTKALKPKLTKAEREALKLQREKERAEAKAKKEVERQRKEKEKQQRELERKEKQHKKELEMKERQERKEREEQERKERKEKKESERRKKEEEKKKSELEKEQAKEQKLRKVEQQKQNFLKYFTKLPPKETAHKKDLNTSDYGIVTPFSIKTDMSLAPRPRESLSDKTEFDSTFKSQATDIFSDGFIENCKRKLPRRVSTKSAPLLEKPTTMSDDVMIVPSTSSSPRQQHNRVKRKFKLLQFHRNYRPAYFGTWSKTSKIVSPRNPLRRDEGLLVYEVDSDDEWEEEEPGESLSDSEGEEADSDEDSGDDDGFFVPHGYLSDGEGDQSDGEGGLGLMDMDGDDCKKQKQLAKAKAWEAEFARKCQRLKPIKIGCVWSSGLKGHGGEVESKYSKEEEFLWKFAAVSLVELPISVETKGETTAEKGSSSFDSTRRPVPNEAMPDLIRLVHGASMGLHRLIDTFRNHWGAKKYHEQHLNNPPPSSFQPSAEKTLDQSPPSLPPIPSNVTPKTPSGTIYAQASGISKRQLEKKIQAIATKDSRPPTHKYLWHVHENVFKQYNLDPSTLVPLLVSPSPRSIQKGTKASSPETPTTVGAGGAVKSAKKGLKRKLDGMKTLTFLGQSPNSKPDSFEVPPDTKRSKTTATSSVIVTNVECSLKPSANVVTLQLKPTTAANGCTHSIDIPVPKSHCLGNNNVPGAVTMDTQPPPSSTLSPTSKENAPFEIKALLSTPVLPQFFIDQQKQQLLVISPAVHALKESTNASSSNTNEDPTM